MKLTQKVDHFTVSNNFPSTSCCSQKLLPNLAVWTSEAISGMFTLGGCREMEGWAKVRVVGHE